jgi:TRAP-type uncharacterized transport system substrate-binding protein
VLVITALVGVFILATVNRDQRLTLGTATPGSASYEFALSLKTGLERRGFDVDVVSTERTSELIDLLSDPDNPVDVTFVQDTVDAERYPTVTSVGTVSRQPYVFGTWPGSHGITSISQMRGLRIDIGPVGSIREVFLTQLFALFGVTQANTTFVHLPARPTAEEFAAADPDVTATLWDNRIEYLRAAAIAGDVRLVAIPESLAVADRIASAQAMDIPVGSIQLSPPIPAEPVPTVGQLGTVVVDEHVSPAAVYAIAQELVQVFAVGGAWSDPGEFPNFADRQLPVNNYAAEYYATNSIPWQYENLPPLLADSFVSLLILASIVLIVGSVYSIFLPEAYTLWTGIIRPRSEERYIAAMERQVAGGGELSRADRSRLEAILRKHEAERALRDRAQNLRSQSDGTVG